MASTYSPKLKFELIGAGEQAGLWGTTTNKNVGELIEQAIAGVTNVDLTSISGDYVLSSLDGTIDQARSAVVSCFGTAAAAVNIIIPTSTKLYVFRNACGFPITIKTAGQVGGVVLASGEANSVFCDGAIALAGLVTAGSGTVPVSGGGTGNTSFTSGFVISPVPGGTTALTTISSINLSTMVSGQLGVANGGTGISTTPTAGSLLIGTSSGGYAVGSLTQGTGITITPSSGGITISTSGASGVSSFNGRVGAVSPQSSDYSSFYATTSALSSYALLSGATFSGAVSATSMTTGSLGTTGAIISTGGYITSQSGGYASIGGSSIILNNVSTGMYCDGGVFGWQFNGTVRMQLTSGGTTYNTTGTYAAFSDARIKENVVAAPNYLDKICALNVVNFNYIDNPQKMLGFVAQEVEQVMPGLVEVVDNKNYPDVADLKGVKLTVLIPMLVQAVQELKAEVDSLKAQLGAK